jgi:hypothetical protein
VSAKPRTMSEHQASRTLLKSPPELWAECSDAQSLARHLDDVFGEVRITRLEPEQAVAWEGERVSGTVRLEPSGWGTKVTLTANAPDEPPGGAVATEPAPPQPPFPLADAPADAPTAPGVAEAPSRPEAVEAPKPIRMGFFGRLRYLLSAPTAVSHEPSAPSGIDEAPAGFAHDESSGEPEPAEPAIEPEPARSHLPEPDPSHPPEAPGAETALNAALDSLGKAHHRPFSRA